MFLLSLSNLSSLFLMPSHNKLLRNNMSIAQVSYSNFSLHQHFTVDRRRAEWFRCWVKFHHELVARGF